MLGLGNRVPNDSFAEPSDAASVAIRSPDAAPKMYAAPRLLSTRLAPATILVPEMATASPERRKEAHVSAGFCRLQSHQADGCSGAAVRAPNRLSDDMPVVLSVWI